MAIEWDRGALPSLGSFAIVDVFTGGALLSVNMREENVLILENPALTQVAIVFSALVDYTYDLEPGWHMVSLPLAVEDASLAAIFPDAISLFGFESGYYPSDEMSPLQGYWVNIAEGGEYTI